MTFHLSERHLRCVWYDPRLRPAELVTETGQVITVEEPGRWNVEAGPDFLDAVIIDKQTGRRICGSVELHLKPADWNSHGHSGHPAYSNIIVHVCFAPGLLPDKDLPAGCHQVSVQRNMGSAFISFGSLDLSAYPHSSIEDPPPCREAIRRRGPELQDEMLIVAGRFRIAQKINRFRKLADAVGLPQSFYEETMCALGYKHNKQQFRRVATVFRYDDLRRLCAGSPEDSYAILLGVSGLIPADIPAKCDAESAFFIRRLWDAWWKISSAYSDAAMKRSDWSLAGIRPLNQPARRMAAAAAMFSSLSELWQDVLSIDISSPADWVQRMERLLESRSGFGYFMNRLSIAGKPSMTKNAVLGRERIHAMLSNVIIPFLGAYGRNTDELVMALHSEHDNSEIRESAHNLLGHDHNPALYRRNGIKQQGLLQIYHDFCLNSKEACSECRLMKRISAEDENILPPSKSK